MIQGSWADTGHRLLSPGSTSFLLSRVAGLLVVSSASALRLTGSLGKRQSPLRNTLRHLPRRATAPVGAPLQKSPGALTALAH